MTKNVTENEALSEAEIKNNLKELNQDWQIEDGQLVLSIRLESFSDVIDKVNEVAKIAQDISHHPNLYIHDFKSLSIEIYTHSMDAITKYDFKLARAIDLIL